MERIQKWFGGGDAKSPELKYSSERSTTIVKQEKSLMSTDATSSDRTAPESTEGKTSQETSSQQVKLEQPGIPDSASVTETRVGQLLNEGRDMILRVIPLEEGDCLSCKLIGSGVMWGTAAFILLSYPKMKARYTGFRRTLCALQVGSLATTLALLGTARFFDVSIFTKPDTDGNRKSIGQLVGEDVDNVYKYSSRLFSADTPSDSKRES